MVTKSPPATDATQSTDNAEVQTVTMASAGSDADIWRYIAGLPETKEAGIKLEVKDCTDYVYYEHRCSE